ncbi:MAG: hypothetical protein MUP02_00600 [Actinobacteria bacterium]|nr:hypothetical protein [Actinomycetota bacterium]
MGRKFWIIFLKSIGLFAAGVALGYLFYYFFKEQSAYIIERFKVLQQFFGVNEYSEGMTFFRVFITIFVGNFISTILYFVLGYLRLSMPVSFISGLFISIFLFSGIVRHGISIPTEVIILSSTEMLYRIITISSGGYIHKYRLSNKVVPILSISVVIILYIAASFYEIIQIFK